MALSLTIGPAVVGPQIEYIQNLFNFNSIIVQDSIQVAGDTFDFDIFIENFSITEPKAGNEVIFRDGATKEFAGTLIDVGYFWGPQLSHIIYHCKCRDYTWVFNKQIVNDTYDLSHVNSVLGQSETTLFAGNVVKAILKDLETNSNNGAGDDIYYQSFNTDLSKIEQGPAINPQTFDKIYPSQTFDTIAQGTAMQWYIDYDKVIHFVNIISNVSPLTNNELLIDTDLTTYYDYEEHCNIENTSSQLILRDVKNRAGATITDEFEGSKGESFNSGSGSQDNKIFHLTREPFSFADITSITKNTGGGPVTQTKLPEDIGGSLEGDEGSATDVFARVIESDSYIRFSKANSVADTDDIAVTYFYMFTDDNEGINTNGIDEMKKRVGGDGIHQFVYSQTSGLKITDPNQLDEINNTLLFRKSTILLRGTFSTWVKGWVAGQSYTRKWDLLSLNDIMYVVSVTKRILTPADDPNLSDNVIVSEITFSNMPYGVTL